MAVVSPRRMDHRKAESNGVAIVAVRSGGMRVEDVGRRRFGGRRWGKAAAVAQCVQLDPSSRFWDLLDGCVGMCKAGNQMCPAVERVCWPVGCVSEGGFGIRNVDGRKGGCWRPMQWQCVVFVCV